MVGFENGVGRHGVRRADQRFQPGQAPAAVAPLQAREALRDCSNDGFHFVACPLGVEGFLYRKVRTGATVMGGDTIVGEGSTIGANVFLTNSVPANSLVVQKDANVEVMSKKDRAKAAAEFQI